MTRGLDGRQLLCRFGLALGRLGGSLSFLRGAVFRLRGSFWLSSPAFAGRRFRRCLFVLEPHGLESAGSFADG